jgi:hypothetical protein
LMSSMFVLCARPLCMILLVMLVCIAAASVIHGGSIAV